MTIGTMRDYLKVWTVAGDDDAERAQAKQLEENIDTIREKESTVWGKIPMGSDWFEQTTRWQEERDYEYHCTASLSTTTITFSGDMLGAAITADALRQNLKDNMILERPSDGLQVILSSINYGALTATATAHGNIAVLSDDLAPVQWDIIGNADSDENETHQPTAISPVFRFCGTQIHEEVFKFLHTWKNTKFENIKDNVARQVAKISYKMAVKQARSCLRVAPVYSGGVYVTGDATANPTMTGICQWPRICNAESALTNTYVNASGAELTLPDLDDLIYYMEIDNHSDFDKGKWYLVCHPVQHRYIAEFLEDARRMTMESTKAGYTVTSYMAKNGAGFQILKDRHMRPDIVMVANLGAMKQGYFRNSKMVTKDLATQSMSDVRLFYTQQAGVVVRNPRAHIGMIYGLPETFA
jgi:hypothetical protein